MARCKLTTMNLRNIRKTREYQCLLIDLVKTGVVGKSAAEGLLGYTIPEGLLGGTTPVTPPDDDNGGEDEESQPRLITIATEVFDGENTVYESFEYDLNNGDAIEDVLSAANEHWPEGDATNGNPFNNIGGLLESDIGIITIGDKHYAPVTGPFDATIEPGMIIEVWYADPLVQNPPEEG